ncbi:MAG: hypothetical protein ACTSRA_06180 [Promethearchaeota archaeon]
MDRIQFDPYLNLLDLLISNIIWIFPIIYLKRLASKKEKIAMPSIKSREIITLLFFGGGLGVIFIFIQFVTDILNTQIFSALELASLLQSEYEKQYNQYLMTHSLYAITIFSLYGLYVCMLEILMRGVVTKGIMDILDTGKVDTKKTKVVKTILVASLINVILDLGMNLDPRLLLFSIITNLLLNTIFVVYPKIYFCMIAQLLYLILSIIIFIY